MVVVKTSSTSIVERRGSVLAVALAAFFVFDDEWLIMILRSGTSAQYCTNCSASRSLAPMHGPWTAFLSTSSNQHAAHIQQAAQQKHMIIVFLFFFDYSATHWF